MKTEKFTIKQFNETYPNDDACLTDIFNKRYGNLKKCPKCKKSASFYKVSNRKCWACQHCSYQLHPLAGTIFHKSDTSLKSWFHAIYLFASSKNGVSAKELERQLGVTYKTAWRMAKQIRLLFKKKAGMLGGQVEVDETYVGPRSYKGKRGRGAGNKAIVLGAVERDNRIVAKVTPDNTAKTVHPFICENVDPKAQIFTDQFATYRTLNKKFGFKHNTVNHAVGEYVRGNVHTNTIEGFFGQFKRSIYGTYHHVSKKHLQSYVDEFSYRYNLRHAPSSEIFPSILEEVVKQV